MKTAKKFDLLVAALCFVAFVVLFTTGAVQDAPPVVGSEDSLLHRLAATGRQGTKGRLVFSDFHHSVALFESDENGHPNATVIVDAEDSAAWFMWYESESPIVADHCTQGFDIICDCEVGDICYIIDGNTFQVYECIAVDTNGINERHDMYLSDGYNFMRGNAPGRLYMYTCTKAGDPYHITVVTWKEKEEDDDNS